MPTVCLLREVTYFKELLLFFQCFSLTTCFYPSVQNSQMPSLQTLYAIVSHFQKLFDVSSLNGVYPRMNEVYTKLGEMTNAMRNLHDLLELGKNSLYFV